MRESTLDDNVPAGEVYRAIFGKGPVGNSASESPSETSSDKDSAPEPDHQQLAASASGSSTDDLAATQSEAKIIRSLGEYYRANSYSKLSQNSACNTEVCYKLMGYEHGCGKCSNYEAA